MLGETKYRSLQRGREAGEKMSTLGSKKERCSIPDESKVTVVSEKGSELERLILEPLLHISDGLFG